MLSITRCLFVSPLIFLAGCVTLGPDYEQPEITVNDSWHNAVVVNLTSEQDTATWWKQLNDPILDKLIERAQARNLGLRSAVASISQAEQLYEAAKGGRLPTIGLNSNYARTQSSSSNPPFVPTVSDFSNAFLNVSWELDLWGRLKRTVESAEASYEASIEDYRDTLVILNAQVARNYVNLRTLQKRIKLARSNVDRQRDTFQMVETRQNVKFATVLDLEQAKLNLATTEATVPALRLELEQTINELSVLLGEQPGTLNEELSKIYEIPNSPEVLAAGIPTDAIRNRPDVRRTERNLAAQTARIGIAKADLYPALSLQGNFGYRSIGDSLIQASNRNWSTGPAVLWNLFSGGRVRNLVNIEEARTEQALVEYEISVLEALRETENSLIGFALERERSERLSKSVQAAESSARLVKQLYRSGLTDFQNVLDTERTLFRQEDLGAVSQGDVLQYAISVYQSIGGGWTAEQHPPQP